MGITLAVIVSVLLSAAHPAWAQSQSLDGETRAVRLAAEKAGKAEQLKPYEPSPAEIWVKRLEEQLVTGAFHWHPFFTSAYEGGGFTLGAGYRRYVGAYNTLDVRGSWTSKGYLRLESELQARRLFNRRAALSVLGGWREATQVGFYGTGTSSSVDDRAHYSFRQPYTSATLDVRPARNWFVLAGGLEYSQWEQRPGEGTDPSVDEVYTPETLPGLDAKVTYLHTRGMAALDWRTAAGYSRRGGFYGVTFHDFADGDNVYGFQQVDYEAIQHVPLGRDAWVLSLHGRVETTYTKDDQTIPFYMLPAVGGGSSLRGFPSWRFRDRHSLLLQAEWRILVNSFVDTALFVDAGKVTDHIADLDLDGLKNGYGIGFRLHGPAATPLRIEFVNSNEGFVVVLSTHASF